MQCGELVYRDVPTMTKGSRSQSRPEKETIHSGHFMVSHFEAEAQDDEDDLAVPVPEEDEVDIKVAVFGQVPIGINVNALVGSNKDEQLQQQISIETSLNKLFQCMSLAYRQKLTSPKWNRFKGIKLRWKDKIRLNNVIWRCWHMQFIMKQNTLVCQFASPLDVDTHIKPEATILEGKYWKRRAEAVTAEYKKWRMYYRNRTLGWGNKDVSDVISDMDVLDWHSQGDNSHMLVDEDYIEFMSDTLFSTITSNQPFAFPDTREIARGASLADFIQPSLGPLQPNLDDFMDTFEPLQDLITAVKLPPVPEETITPDDHVYRNNFSQALMDPNLQHALEQTTQYQSTQMQAQHIPHLPSHIQAGHTEQIMTQGSLASGLQSINQNTSSLNNRPAPHNPNILSRHGGQTFIPQAVNQNPVNQQINLNSIPNMTGQPQPMMMQQPYPVHTSNMISQQGAGTGPMLVQQNVLSSAQHQMQKNSQHYMQNQKMYPHVSVGGFQERNYNMPQSVHQSRVDTHSYSLPSRGCSGRAAYLQDRGPRPRPGPFTPTPYSQFAGAQAAPQPVADKSSYNEQCMERGLSTQHLKTGVFVGNVEQNMAANLSLGGATRFKMPSPPPQVTNTSTHRASGGVQQQQKQPIQPKVENFRSNSLPLGATLGSVLAGSSGGISNRGGARRPRSGSSSPAPPQRRGPAPLVAAASEPLLSQSSVLLAHLLNTKGQGLYKPSSVQSLPQESQQQQPHPVAIIQAIPTNSTTNTQLITVEGSSPNGAPSPQSPLSPGGGEHRRSGHIHSEQKRRYNIKNGFDLLQSLIPQLSENPNAKVSKAAMLQKGAEYIRQLQTERTKMKEEMEGLRQQIESLNNSISTCQSLLPATGAPVSRQRSGRLKEMFDEYVYHRTNENWKFWIFSLLVEPLLTSFNNSVSPASTDELKRSTFLWAEQHCSLVEMRPVVLNSLRSLCTSTDILSEPEKLPDEARAAVNKRKKEPSSSYKK